MTMPFCGMKERITLTLDSELLKQIDQSVDGFHIKNRSHAIELLLLKAMQAEIPDQGIILAAGQQKYIKGYPNIPICMLKVHNKPIMEHIIEMFRKFNVRDILIGICYDKDMIKSHFGNGSRFGVKIRYIEEDEPSGTINIVRKARPFLSENFFITNSDELKDVNLTDMYLTHKENNGSMTMALTTVKQTTKYGIVQLDGTRIRTFTEKPSHRSETQLINAGLYLVNLEALDMIPEDMKMFYEFFPVIAEQNKLIGYHFSGQWFDISSQSDYDQAAKEWNR